MGQWHGHVVHSPLMMAPSNLDLSFCWLGLLASKLRIKDHACFRNEVICHLDFDYKFWVDLFCCISHSLKLFFPFSVKFSTCVQRPLSWLPLSEKKGDPLIAFSLNGYIQYITVFARMLLSCQYGDWLSMIKLFRKYFSLIIFVSFVFCDNFESDCDHGSAL